MDWLRITERLAVPVAMPIVLTALFLTLGRSDGVEADRAIAAQLERSMQRNDQLMAELNDRARRDQATLTALRDRYQAVTIELATMKASLAAQIKAPVQTVDAAPARKRRGRRRKTN